MDDAYLSLFNNCKVTAEPGKLAQIAEIVRLALASQGTYEILANQISIPWPVIAAIHFRESNQNFKCHLHNGDPLTARTVHVPANRPTTGNPPFTWLASAYDALIDRWAPHAWDISGSLEFIERYNGLGYRRRGLNTPYLWDYTDKYSSGLFVADGSFDETAKENRPGAVVILKGLNYLGEVLNQQVH